MNVFRLVLRQYCPIFYHVLPHPPISISEVMIPNHGNGPKSTHGAGPGSKKHKTCTLACLTPLPHAMHGNNSYNASGGYFIIYTQNAEKCQ